MVVEEVEEQLYEVVSTTVSFAVKDTFQKKNKLSLNFNHASLTTSLNRQYLHLKIHLSIYLSLNDCLRITCIY